MPEQIKQSTKQDMPKEFNIAEVSLGQVICSHLDAVMANRAYMPKMEAMIDTWVKAQPVKTAARRNEVLAEMKTAQGCLESLYNRIAQIY